MVDDARSLSLTNLEMLDFKRDTDVFSCQDMEDGMTLTTTSPDGRNEILGFRFAIMALSSFCSSSIVRPNLGLDRSNALKGSAVTIKLWKQKEVY